MAAIPVGSGTSSSSSDRIFQQIEATADYYPPDTYGQLLSFYDDFWLNTDPAGGQFTPLTTTSTRWGEQSILFAVGIIPPAANVTGRLLDRSASIANVAGVGSLSGTTVSNATSGTPGGNGDIRSRIANIATSYNGVGVTSDKDKFVGLLASDNDQKLIKAGYFSSSGISTCGLTLRGIWRQAGLQDPSITGPYQIGSAISGPVGIAQKNGAFYTGKSVQNGSYTPQQGDAVLVNKPSTDGQSHQHIYTVTDVAPDGTITSIDGGQTDAKGQQAIGQYTRTFKVNNDPDSESFGKLQDNNGFSSRDVVGVIDVSKLPFPPATGATSSPTTNAVPGDASSGGWQSNGSGNAQTASQQQAQSAGSPLFSTQTGQDITAAQKNAIQATQQAITNMSNTPPLAMMVNPASFSVKGEKIVNDGSWGRNGPIIEFWGDQQDKISGSGKVAAFFALDNNDANGPGITRWARNYSASWQNFQSLFELYRSNGALFLSDDTTMGMYQNLSMLGSIYIYYDTVIYIGSFDSFSVTESDTAPHTIEYSFEFTVRASFLLDRTDDAFDYGVPQITVGGSIPFNATQPLPFGGGAPPIGTAEAAAAAASQGNSTTTSFTVGNGTLAQQIAARVASTNTGI